MGFMIGIGGLISILMGSVALAEWVKSAWTSESGRARQQRAEDAELPREMVDEAEFAVACREKIFILLRHQRDCDEQTESAGRKTGYVQ
jgi:hypothetical protein